MRPHLLLKFAASLFAASLFAASLSPLAAQQFVVDASGGAGASFTDISAAVAAVPDGSTLLVRPGTYGRVVINSKSVTILCDDGVEADSGPQNLPFLEIRSTQPQDSVAVFNLRRAIPQFSSQSGGILIEAAAGPVTIDGNGTDFAMPASFAALTIENCRQVCIRRLQMTGSPAVRIDDSDAVFESCQLNGRPGATGFFIVLAQFGVVANSSQIQLVHSSAQGGDGSESSFPFILFTPPQAAVSLQGSSLRCTGSAVHELRGGTNPQTNLPAPALRGSGSGTATARIDPSVTVVGAADPSVMVSNPELPSVRSTPTSPGQAFTVERTHPPGGIAILALSVRSAALPTIGADPLWVDPISYVVVDVQATPASGQLDFSFTVPDEPLLRGFQVVWQGVDLDLAGNLLLSNPSPSFVR